MFNASEETTVKARQRHARTLIGLFVGAVASGAFATVHAQTQTLQRGQTAGPRFMVPTFRSNERGLGLQAAEAIRERMGQDFQLKTLWIVPKSDIMTTLVNSGYSTTEALSSNDARALAQLLRAEEYVEGNVEKTPTGYRVTANMMLIRPEGMVQPLPPIEVAKLPDAAKAISNAVEAARKQVDPAKKCVELSRAKNYAGAIAEARKGIAAYPNAVMPRVCIAEIYNEQKLGADSMIAISEQILKLHKDNKRALAFAADAYAEKKMEDKQVEALTRLISLEPTNTTLQSRVVNILAASGKASLALPIVDDAVKNNPGDASLVKLQWLVHFAAKDIKGALVIGEEMVKLDTAAADTQFFIRQSAAYAADSQFQKAAETLARGRAKFPNNMTIATTHVQLLIQSGQTAQAIEEAKKVLSVNPKIPGIWPSIAKSQADAGAPPDTVLNSLRAAKAAGDSVGLVAGYALSLGNAEYKKGNASKNIEDYQRALKYLYFSDSTAATGNSKFLIGVTNLQMVQPLLEQASAKKSCDLAKQAQAALTEANIYAPQGGRDFPKEVPQVMGAVQQLTPYAERSVKALCK
jgi:tetratricopeptide (TPR) repeat protein